MEATNSRIRKVVTKSPISVSRVYKSDYQKKGTLTAELKQSVKVDSFYPSASIANSLQDNIYGMTDFGFEETEHSNTETRVAWIDVPENSTQEGVAAKLATLPGANLYRVLSNRPIIADTEKYAILSPELDVTLDTFANRQAVRYPMGSDNPGELVTDTNGKIQYRRIAFSVSPKEDEDIRTAAPDDFYASNSLKQELNGVEAPSMPSQAL